jgi:hypothetical protein
MGDPLGPIPHVYAYKDRVKGTRTAIFLVAKLSTEAGTGARASNTAVRVDVMRSGPKTSILQDAEEEGMGR